MHSRLQRRPFSLKVVVNFRGPERTAVFGVPFPSKYAAFAELLLIYILFPGTSFVGHLSGILVGIAYLAISDRASVLPSLFARRVQRSWGSGTPSRGPPPRTATQNIEGID